MNCQSDLRQTGLTTDCVVRLRFRRCLVLLPLAAFAALYAGVYIFARSQHWLVHRSACIAGKTDTHTIAVGDLGLGFNPAYRVANVSYVVFTPLRWAETAFWYGLHPAGKPWPYSAENP